MLPKVIIHNAVSADGCITGFPVDLGQYYGLAMGMEEDATLVGCDTMLTAGDEVPEENESAFEPPEIDPDDDSPLLVIPDSRGRLKSWHHWREQPYWSRMVALCSEKTPKKHLRYLEKRHVDRIVAGNKKVDLAAALEELRGRYKVRKVRVDSGGTLNGILLRAGLVDEVSLLVHPTLVGSVSPLTVFHAPEPESEDDLIDLRLTHVEKLKRNIVWLRYKVKKKKVMKKKKR
jgi:2,5-diamino-6-(ribosylamino)-4(3H)-pyrimidinone 5'-phosphate reductase